jgi:alanine racemase
MRPTVAEIDLGAIAKNVECAARLAGPAAAIMAVVKADGYGHGAVPVARTALASGATWLGVAIPEEAAPLRAAGLDCRILVLGPIRPEQAELVVTLRLDQCVTDAGQAEALARAAAPRDRVVPLHLKIETGMGRVGIAPDRAPEVAARIAALSGVRLDGVMTHFAEAEAEDQGFTRAQLATFTATVEALRAAGVRPALRHAANSAALLYVPEARLDLVRPGIMLYGWHPRGGGCRDPVLAPALRLRAAVSQVKDVPRGSSVSYGRTFIALRDTRVATLPLGYADGVPRALSNRGQVLIRGRRAPIIGRVCMDMLMVDATTIPDVGIGDEAVLIGRQGDSEISADEVAALLGTISYEVLCRIGPRVPRVYLSARPDASGSER